ncbi:hypothetical protein IFM89_022263 [Coptis chinensis]|uniref:Uncharacterized protein n=1 Tax=Coptis chinensis TaxID=261450 RepID=A0A835HGJ6_9MAGN|nr:hypothetical protein IFM89_022263 [Coptis chinensis]
MMRNSLLWMKKIEKLKVDLTTSLDEHFAELRDLLTIGKEPRRDTLSPPIIVNRPLPTEREFKPKVDIPEFTGILEPEVCLEWISTLDNVFVYQNMSEDHKVSWVATRLRAYKDTSEGTLTYADKGLPMLMVHVSSIVEYTRDNGSSFSLISRRMVDILGLTTMVHRRPRKVHSFRVGDFEKLAETVRVGVHMGYFSDYVICHGRRVFTLCNQPMRKMASYQILLAKAGKDAYLPPHRCNDWRSKKTFNSSESSSSSGGPLPNDCLNLKKEVSRDMTSSKTRQSGTSGSKMPSAMEVATRSSWRRRSKKADEESEKRHERPVPLRALGKCTMMRLIEVCGRSLRKVLVFRSIFMKVLLHFPPRFEGIFEMVHSAQVPSGGKTYVVAAFPSERLGMGAFRIALESIFNRIHSKALEYTSLGKPNPFVFKNAEAVLRELHLSTHHRGNLGNDGHGRRQTFKTLYMIGDNPSVDVKGARQAGHPWFSILTRTGVFKGKENHDEFPADLEFPHKESLTFEGREKYNPQILCEGAFCKEVENGLFLVSMHHASCFTASVCDNVTSVVRLSVVKVHPHMRDHIK